MNGVTIIARMSAADSMPKPSGGPLKRGSCRSEAGTARAGVGLGAGTNAGRLIVARASLVHQINAAAAAITATIAAAANTSALVRRSGLTIERC